MVLFNGLKYLRIEAALSALLLVCGLSAAMHVVIPLDVMMMCFFASWAMYMMDAEIDVSPEDRLGNSSRYVFFEKHARFTLILRQILIASTCLIGFFRWQSLWGVKWQLLVLVLLCGAYVSPALPLVRRWPKVKTVTPMKTIIIPLAWLIGATALIRAFGPGFPEVWFSFERWFAILFFFLLLDTLLLDWMDRDADRAMGTHSIPVDYPKFALILIAFSLGVVACASFFDFGWKGGLLLSFLTIGLIASIWISRLGVELIRIVWLVVFWRLAVA